MLKAVVVIRAAAHPVKILRNNRVIGIRQCKPIQWLVAVVTGGRSNSQPDEASITSVLRHFRQDTNDHIRSQPRASVHLHQLRLLAPRYGVAGLAMAA